MAELCHYFAEGHCTFSTIKVPGSMYFLWLLVTVALLQLPTLSEWKTLNL